MNKKITGSYYTPYKTVAFMLKYLQDQNKNINYVLEPSAGDGRFVDAIINNNFVKSIVAVELYEEKSKILLEKNYPPKVSIITSDFLEFANSCNEKFDLIIGNPPYINLKNMNKEFLIKARDLCNKYNLTKTVIQNAWVAFVLASLNLINDKGTIFFVLPLEFLQVQYAEQLRAVLEKQFNTIHILTFSERMFPEIEQEVCLVYLTNQEQDLPYISYKQLNKLDSSKIFFESKIERNKPLKKWSNAMLSDADIDLLNNTAIRYTLIKDLGESSPGIVTGANNKFILTKQEVQKYQCSNFVMPIIAKSSMVRNCFAIDERLMENLSQRGNKIYLLNLTNINEDNLPKVLRDYLKEVGTTVSRGKKIIEGYKCAKRKPWYGVPIDRSGDLVFFKRYDTCPRLCTNPQRIHTTDIAYNIRLIDAYDAESVAFCFYNSLTLAQCEFVGRYYAGGVSELIPSEFKSLSIPYYKISEADITFLKIMFEEEKPLETIVKYVNSKTLELNLGKDEIYTLDNIRMKLMQRRKTLIVKK